MIRFDKLSHVLWHCQYHIVWVPKYRYRVLTGKVGFEALKTIRVCSERLGCEVVEINVHSSFMNNPFNNRLLINERRLTSCVAC